MSDGTSPIVGAVVSWTVMWKDADELFPCESVAVHATVVVPSGNVEPDAGVQPDVATGSSGSENVTVYVTARPAADVASATMSDGTTMSGAVVSATPKMPETSTGTLLFVFVPSPSSP